MVYVYNLNPVIFSIGFIQIRWYSLVYIVGFILAFYVLKFAIEKKKIKLTKKELDDFIFYFMISSIIGGRLGYVLFYNPLYYMSNLLKIFAVWEGGMSFHGGLLGAVLYSIYFTKRHKVTFYKLADLLVVPFAGVLVLGRIANFINGELFGHVTTPEKTPWCVVYDGECRHPSQIYEAIKNLITFIVLLFMQFKIKLKEGIIFWAFVLIYGLGRFITDFWRAPDPTDPMLGGLLIGQYLSLIMVIFSLGFLYFLLFYSENL